MSKQHPRRLSDADAMFLHVEEATGQPAAPVGIGIYEGPFDPELREHLRELQKRMSSRGRQRIVRDRWSPALPRWVDVPGFDPDSQAVELPPPGDGTLRAVIDWAEAHALDPFPEGRPPWRSTTFHGVLVDGIPRTVSVGQSHHAMIDGEGGRRLGLRMVQFAADEPLPPIPDEPEEPFEEIGPLARWVEGWRLELISFGALLSRTARRAAWAGRHPVAAGRRARSITGDVRTLRSDLGHQAHSPLLAAGQQRRPVRRRPRGPRRAAGRIQGGRRHGQRRAHGRGRDRPAPMAPRSRSRHRLGAHVDHGEPARRRRHLARQRHDRGHRLAPASTTSPTSHSWCAAAARSPDAIGPAATACA